MTYVEEYKKHKKWQNLVHMKCPNCNTRLEDARLYLKCPNLNPNDETKNCFFIKKDKAVEFIMDPAHPANFCMSLHEREMINGFLAEIGQVLPSKSEAIKV